MVPCANQFEIHPHFTREKLRKYCKKEGIFVQAFASLARMAPQLVQEPLIIKTAKKYNTNAILLAWARCQGIGVIPKSTLENELKANIEMTKLNLSQEEIESISNLNLNKNYIECCGWCVT
ncbi:glyoxal reductase domain protein [Cooperia oncophora]